MLGLAHAAQAETTIKSVGPDPTQTVSFIRTETVYEAAELVSTDQPLIIHLDQVPEAIEMREIYQGAIGEDGPWSDVPQTETMSSWTPLDSKQDLTINLGPDHAPTISWPKTFSCQEENLDQLNCTRWQKRYASCKGQGVQPCYTYRAGLEFKIQYKGANRPDRLVVKFPGGC